MNKLVKTKTTKKKSEPKSTKKRTVEETTTKSGKNTCNKKKRKTPTRAERGLAPRTDLPGRKIKNPKVMNVGVSARKRAKLRAEGKLPPPKQAPNRTSWKPGQRVAKKIYGFAKKQDYINTIIEEMMKLSPAKLRKYKTSNSRIEWARQLLMQSNRGDKAAIKLILDRWKGPVTQFVVQKTDDEASFDPRAPLELHVIKAKKVTRVDPIHVVAATKDADDETEDLEDEDDVVDPE